LFAHQISKIEVVDKPQIERKKLTKMQLN